MLSNMESAFHGIDHFHLGSPIPEDNWQVW
jgi:hypothetical protein